MITVNNITVKDLREILNTLEEDAVIKLYNEDKFQEEFIIDAFKDIKDGKQKVLIYPVL